MTEYADFLARKAAVSIPTGIEDVPPLGDYLSPFQKDIVSWGLRRGRCAFFADTGLGKTRMMHEWASQVCAYLDATGEAPANALLLAPLAVAEQSVREGASIGIDVHYCRSQSAVRPGLTITNYDMIDRFDPSQFGAVVLDESSILKSYDGPTRTGIIDAFAGTPFKLSCSATPSPNEFDELGSQAQFLGILSLAEMRAMYFTHDGGETQKWRLKGHAKDRFWRWVCSWAAMIKRPSDLGYSDVGYALPPLTIVDHVMPAELKHARDQNLEMGATATLFPDAAKGLTEQRRARRSTLEDRVKVASEIVRAEPNEHWIVWCELNDESEALTKAIPGAFEIRGSHSPEQKRDRLMGFCGPDIRVLVTKPSIAGFGMNWQHAARMIFVGVTHSYEQFYQAVRREWRFGQKREVICHVVTSELEGRVVANLRRKEADAAKMAEELRAYTSSIVRDTIRGATLERTPYDPQEPMTVPAWCLTDATGADTVMDLGPAWQPTPYPGEPVETATQEAVWPEWLTT